MSQDRLVVDYKTFKSFDVCLSYEADPVSYISSFIQGKKKKNCKNKDGHAQRYRQAVREIGGVSPDEEKQGYTEGRICGTGKFS